MVNRLFNLEGAQLKDHNSVTPMGASLGQIVQDSGHLYMYVKAGAAIAANEPVIMQPAYKTFDNATGIDNVGDRATGKYPSITETGLGATVNDYVGMYLYIDAGTGAGQMKRIVKNSATQIWYEAIHKGFGTNHEDDPFTTDPDTTSDCTIISPFTVIKAAVTDPLQIVLGVAPFAFTSGYYGWVCITGAAIAKYGTNVGSAAAGTYVTAGDNTAGQLSGLPANETIDDVNIAAIALNAAADDQTIPLWLGGKVI